LTPVEADGALLDVTVALAVIVWLQAGGHFART
jgi:hypothetical protein